MKQYVNEYDKALDTLTSGMIDTSDIEPYMDAIVELMKTLEVDKWEDLKGKYV